MISSCPVEVKRECVRLKESGIKVRTIYSEYYLQNTSNPMSYDSFRAHISRWSKYKNADDRTLTAGTYEGFVAHDATVQVSKTGKVIQAWIKQSASEINTDEFIEAVKAAVEPKIHRDKVKMESDYMLEIPLFDMHWGIAYKDDYSKILVDILNVINSKRWEDIYIPIGQDLFHNDSIAKGITTKGTPIERVNMKRAVKDACEFIFELIDSSIDKSNNVHVLYSPGNHDRTVSWMFMQVLLQRYGPDIVDDELVFRKVITFGTNSIMVTHGDSRQATPNNLAHIFPIEFPKEFGESKIREVHAGHLHKELDADIFGVMVRRLSANNKTDEWTDMEDFVGTNKRFMLFEWSKDKLSSIHYI